MLADIFITFFAFLGIMMVTAIVFGVWVIASIIGVGVRVVRWGARSVFPSSQAASRMVAVRRGTVQCQRPRCGAENPEAATFCRRCGQRISSVAAEHHVAVRRVAMW